MGKKEYRLAQLRTRAEALLKHAGETPNNALHNIDEVIHELSVYHVELEIQIEDLQQSYRALEAAEKRYANLFEFAPVGYVLTDLHGIIINANLTACSMLGVARQALEASAFAEFITTDFQDIYHLYRRAVLQTRQAQACEVQLRRADGSIFHAQLNTDLLDSQSETLRTAITNVSTIKQAEEALRRALDHEKEIGELRTRLLSMISHEFRTPLSIMLASVETLAHYDDKLTPEKKQQRYQTIRNLIWHLNETVQDASSIHAIDDQPKLKLVSIDALPFMRQIVNDMATMTKEGQEIILEISAQHENEPVTWDPNLLRRIVMNLLNNALHYSEESILCSIECETAMIRLRVEDRGKGISEEDQQHMYEAFYRGKNVEFDHGTGIGLFVVQRAVQAHGGTIHCISRLGEGTTFIVELPRQVPDPLP